jgi:hypothetical protein
MINLPNSFELDQTLPMSSCFSVSVSIGGPAQQTTTAARFNKTPLARGPVTLQHKINGAPAAAAADGYTQQDSNAKSAAHGVPTQPA